MRLDRFLANRGYGSRSACKKIIHRERVKVNGKVTTVNDLMITDKDVITLDDQVIENLPYATIMLNKPSGYLCSMIDEHYPSVMHLVPDFYKKRVRMVGRLDQDTTGLLLLTDNGVLNTRLANPKYQIEKVYEVEVNHPLLPDLVALFAQGNIDIGRGNFSKPAGLEIVNTRVGKVTIHEGKYHEVKNLFKHFGYEVIKLRRLSLGPIALGDLPLGEYRKLTETEYQELLKITHLDQEENNR